LGKNIIFLNGLGCAGMIRYAVNFQSKPCIQDDFAIPLGPGTGPRHLRLEASHATGSAARFVAMSLAADL